MIDISCLDPTARFWVTVMWYAGTTSLGIVFVTLVYWVQRWLRK